MDWKKRVSAQAKFPVPKNHVAITLSVIDSLVYSLP